MATNNEIQAIFGADHVPELGESFLEVLKKNGIKHLDTAANYVGSEEALGQFGASKDFIIDTKAKGFGPGVGTRDSINDSMKTSLELLKVDQVETYYLHSPDAAGTPLSETLAAINELYSQGKFKYFGLSNFPASQVEEIYNLAKENNYILPTVFQGSYNAFSRANESDIIPLARKLNMSFRAYSPIAGGLLVKSSQQIKDKVELGRMDPSNNTGAGYQMMYNKPELLDALDEWEKLANDSGIAKGALAYRFLKYNSALQPGDSILVGVSKVEQLEQAVQWLKDGPLPQDVVTKIDQIWQSISEIAPRDMYVDVFLEVLKNQ